MPEMKARSSSIDVVGADANNLKNIDVKFPIKRISVVAGVSGSGKSSLLADTLAAEGSRRMRTFLGASQELERDNVRAFVGALPATILVGQRGFRPNTRTTVGTATGFLSILRRLFVLTSVPYSDRLKVDVPSPSPRVICRLDRKALSWKLGNLGGTCTQSANRWRSCNQETCSIRN